MMWLLLSCFVVPLLPNAPAFMPHGFGAQVARSWVRTAPAQDGPDLIEFLQPSYDFGVAEVGSIITGTVSFRNVSDHAVEVRGGICKHFKSDLFQMAPQEVVALPVEFKADAFAKAYADYFYVKVNSPDAPGFVCPIMYTLTGRFTIDEPPGGSGWLDPYGVGLVFPQGQDTNSFELRPVGQDVSIVAIATRGAPCLSVWTDGKTFSCTVNRARIDPKYWTPDNNTSLRVAVFTDDPEVERLIVTLVIDKPGVDVALRRACWLGDCVASSSPGCSICTDIGYGPCLVCETCTYPQIGRHCTGSCDSSCIPLGQCLDGCAGEWFPGMPRCGDGCIVP